jgi:SAM-dependent methyltransferase
LAAVHVIDPARSFELAAEEYERTRPDYPDAVLEAVPLPTESTVLDVGAGTGKLTRVLARRYARVIAVEPLDGMRTILERVVPDAEALAGRAEDIPLPDASVGGVFAGQAFHWFANDEAVAEIARVIRPGGVFCLVWNSADEQRETPLPRPYLDYLDELRAERQAEGLPFKDVIARGPFAEVHEAAVPHDHVLDRAGLLDNARSVSWIASRPPNDHERVMRRLGELLPEGTYSIPNLANVLWAVRT